MTAGTKKYNKSLQHLVSSYSGWNNWRLDISSQECVE
jgi:hypothetical protein